MSDTEKLIYTISKEEFKKDQRKPQVVSLRIGLILLTFIILIQLFFAVKNLQTFLIIVVLVVVFFYIIISLTKKHSGTSGDRTIELGVEGFIFKTDKKTENYSWNEFKFYRPQIKEWYNSSTWALFGSPLPYITSRATKKAFGESYNLYFKEKKPHRLYSFFQLPTKPDNSAEVEVFISKYVSKG